MIFGSRGYVGGRLLRKFEQEGYSVVTLNRVSREELFRFELVDGDRSQIGDLQNQAFIENIQNLDVVVNAAANVSKEQDVQTVSDLVVANSLMTAILGAHFVNNPTHLIHLGTYSFKSDQNIYDPQTFYAATKKAGEDFLEYFATASSGFTTILHLYDIYGPGQPHKRLIPTVGDKLARGKQVKMSPGEQDFTPLFIEDLEHLMLQMTNQGRAEGASKFQIYDVYGPDTVKVKYIPGILAKSIGLNPDKIKITFDGEYRDREIMKFNPCHPLPPLDINWTSLGQGLEKTFSQV